MKNRTIITILSALFIMILMSPPSNAAIDITKTSLPISLKDATTVRLLPGNNDSFVVLADTKYAIDCFVLNEDGSSEQVGSFLDNPDSKILSFTALATPKRHLLFAVTRSNASGIVRLVVQRLTNRGKERGRARILWQREMPAASAFVTAEYDNRQVMCAVSISQNSPKSSGDPLSTFLYIKTKQSGKAIGTPRTVTFDTAENYYFVRPGEPNYRGNGWMIPICLTEFRINLTSDDQKLGSDGFEGNAVEVLNIPDNGQIERKQALRDEQRPDITYAFAEFIPPGPTPTLVAHYDLLVQIRVPASISGNDQMFTAEYMTVPINQFGDPSPTAYKLPIPSYKPNFGNIENSRLFKQIDLFSKPVVLGSRAFIQHLRSTTFLSHEEGTYKYHYQGQLNLYEIDPVLRSVKLIDKRNPPKRGAHTFINSLLKGDQVYSVIGRALFDSSNDELSFKQFDTWLLSQTLP